MRDVVLVMRSGKLGELGGSSVLRLSAVCYMLVISIESTISLILVISCYF